MTRSRRRRRSATHRNLILFALLIGAGVLGVWRLGLGREERGPQLPDELASAISPSGSASSSGLGVLRSPEGSEGWLAGADLAHELIGADTNPTPATEGLPQGSGSMVLIAFTSCAESSSFFVADGLLAAMRQMPGVAGALAVLVPRPSPRAGHAPLLCTAKDLGTSLLTVPLFQDASFRAWRAFGAENWPHVVLVDRVSGRIVRHWQGREFLQQWPPPAAAYAPGRPGPKRPGRGSWNTSLGPSKPQLSPSFLPLAGLAERLVARRHLITDATALGESIYLADAAAHTITKVTKNGQATIAAGHSGPGYQDGPLATAQLRFPHRVVADPASGRLFIADWGNRALRVLRMTEGEAEVRSIPLPSQVIPEDLLFTEGHLLLTSVLSPSVWIAKIEDHGTHQPPGDSSQQAPTSPLMSFREIALPNDFASGIALTASPGGRVLLTALRSGARLALEVQSGSTASVLPLDRALDGGIVRSSAACCDEPREWRGSLAPESSPIVWLLRDESGTALRAQHDAQAQSEPAQMTEPNSKQKGPLQADGIATGWGKGPVGRSSSLLAWNHGSGDLCRISTTSNTPHAQQAQGPAARRAECLKPILPDAPEAAQPQEATKTPVHLASHEEVVAAFVARTSPMVLKAGAVSTLTLSVRLPPTHRLSSRDLQLLQTPDKDLLAWNPEGSPTFTYRAPQQRGPSAFVFRATVCQAADPRACTKVTVNVAVEIRTSFHEATARADVLLEL